ncbi:MAG: hypothetical protein ACI89X_001735 [Planctomycetota bacterium]|jgi:hypothetical protein
MRLPILSAALAAICLSLPATAQKVQVFGGNGMRANSSLILFGAELMAGITVTHGQPEWKDDYTNMLGKLKGNTNRLGKDLWTTFMTSVPISLGGKMVPAGSYVVGLNCDKQGNFALAMLDANKAMKKGAMPFGPQNWKADVMTPLKLNKNVTKESVAKMTMTLASDKKDPMTGSFTLAWGPHTLTADLKILPKMKKKEGRGEHKNERVGGHEHGGGK